MRAKCAKCHDIVEVSHLREYKTCKCGAISLDYGDGYYSRMGGAPEDFDQEFDKEQGIDRFKPFKLEHPETCNANCDFYTVEAEKKYTAENMAGLPELETHDMNTLVTLVWEWFEHHNLHDPIMQYVKMQEECGELAHELTRGNRKNFEIEDALGDILVTVIGLCHHLGYHPAHVLWDAYYEISKRKGKVIDGSFVKEEND